MKLTPEDIQNKFDNFRVFIEGELPDNCYVPMIFAVGMTPFLETCYQRRELPIDEIIELICDKIGVSRGQFSDEVLQRFQLYIEFFIAVSKQIYDQ